MIILPILEWFMSSHTYLLAIFLIVFISGLLRLVLVGRR